MVVDGSFVGVFMVDVIFDQIGKLKKKGGLLSRKRIKTWDSSL